MNSLERNNFSLKNRNNIGIQNKVESSLSIITNSLNHNKMRLLNLVDKSTFMNNLDKKLNKINNEQKSKNKTIQNNKRILNKLVVNQIKKEKESFKTKTDKQKIQTIENNKNNAYNSVLNIHNINSYRGKAIPTEKNKNKKFVMESHHLINSLLKNQNKNTKKERLLSNEFELSLSLSSDKERKNKKDLSSSKDSMDLINNDSKKGEFLYPRNIKRINQDKKEENNNIINTSLENNIYSGINKENKDINLVKNTKELFISPLYNLDNNNINTHRVYRSPLRMADVFHLKKHHSINPQLNKVLTDNIIIENENNDKLKKTPTQNKEKNLVDNIKRIQNLKVNLIQRDKDKEKDNSKKEYNQNNDIKENITIENDKELVKKDILTINKNEENKNLINGINRINETIDKVNKIEKKAIYNGRNDIIELPKSKYLSQTIDKAINETSISFRNNKIKAISPIKTIHLIKNNINNNKGKENKTNEIDNILIKVNKIKLEKTIEENSDINKSIHSIRRRFMNSKNKYNNHFRTDIDNNKILTKEIKTEEKYINKKEIDKIQKTDINQNLNINITIINNNDIPSDINGLNPQSEIKNNIIEMKNEENKPKEEKKLNQPQDVLKSEETENLPEIKFQSESEKENRMKRDKKYKQKKEKEKEKKVLFVIKIEDRNNKPLKKLKKFNSFSFGTLFSLSNKMNPKKNNNNKSKKEEIKTNEEKNEKDEDNKIINNNINRNLSPICKEINKKELNVITDEIDETKKILKKLKSENNIKENDKKDNIDNNLNTNNDKKKKKVIISENIKIEEINTTKPVTHIKIYELLNNNKLKVTNNDDNIHKRYNNLFIFGLDKANIIKFDIRKKRYNKIKISDIEDISDSFQSIYNYENSLLYNILTGLFILTGADTNIFYYYDKEHDMIIKLCQFSSSHQLGCLLLDKNKIFIFSGKNNNICEYYDFNTEKTEKIPELNYDRANSSFCFCNDNIYTFFGYSFKKEQFLFNIEYIDKNKLDKWNEIFLNIDDNVIQNNALINISLFNYNKDPNKIFIYGGKKGIEENDENIIEGYYYIYDIEKNNFEKIDNVVYNIKKEYKRFTVKKYEEEKNKKNYFFNKQKQFIEIPEEYDFDKNNENLGVNIDFDNNIHFLTKKRNCVNVCQYLK